MPITRRRLLTGLAGLTAAGGLGVGAAAQGNSYYGGPLTDHFDGTRFFDPNGSAAKSLPDLIRWQLTRQRAPWPERQQSSYADRPPQRVDNPRDWRVSYIGHASFLLQAAGLNILIDPVWSERASPVGFAGPKRVNDPGIAFDLLPPIDVVLVSHGHYDHLDVATLGALATPHRPRIVTPLGNDTVIRAHDPAARVEAYDWHKRVPLSFSGDVAVTLVPTRHWSARGLLDRNKTLWAGFVIETPAGRILHVADSGYGDGYYFHKAREQYGPFRLAILPIGAYEPRWFMRDHHMNPEEAVRAMADCGAERALAHHFGTFPMADEAVDKPEADLALARKAAGLSAEQFLALRPGQVLEL
jgi:L-ascorbate metabolism protein UlaG (beta-lactamase superfamily)